MLAIVPISFDDAKAFIRQHHRHHVPPQGHKFSIAASDGERIVGVACIGRPVARMLDDGWTLEVTRLATDGTANACSFLYARAWRIVQAMGFRRLITYILDSEPGVSLAAAGWRCIGRTHDKKGWDRAGRPRVERNPGQKLLWEA